MLAFHRNKNESFRLKVVSTSSSSSTTTTTTTTTTLFEKFTSHTFMHFWNMNERKVFWNWIKAKEVYMELERRMVLLVVFKTF